MINNISSSYRDVHNYGEEQHNISLQPYFHNQEQQKNSNNKINSLNGVQANQSSAYNDDDSHRCFCFESDDDSADRVRLKDSRRKIARSCISNLIICFALVVYIFVGANIFLAIEDDWGIYSVPNLNKVKDIPFGSSKTFNPNLLMNSNTTVKTWLSRLGEESRAKTMENIWDITISLNILYKENWTRLVDQEITRFQKQLFQKIVEEMSMSSQSGVTNDVHGKGRSRPVEWDQKIEWSLAKAFLYSLTVLTTIGYGHVSPRTTVGKAVTMGYAAIGIPFTLLYLSSMGSLLSNCARDIFTRSLCCCLCSNCGYCCYDEKRMQEKERRMRKKREQKEYEQQIETLNLQEPFNVRSSLSEFTSTSNNFYRPPRVENDVKKMTNSRASSTVSNSECPGTDISIDGIRNSRSNFLAPTSFCVVIMVIYVCGGALIFCHLESSWTYLDAIFFCFMTLSTIGFGESIPLSSVLSTKLNQKPTEGNLILWFCSLYIFSGMTLSAMCFNIIHDVIVYRLKYNCNESSGSSKIIKQGSVSNKLVRTSNLLDNDTKVNNTSELPVTS